MKMWLVVLGALAACNSREQSRPPPATVAPAPADAAVSPRADASVIAEHMKKHFAAVSALQRAIARGHMDDARMYARSIVSHDEPLDPAWRPYVDDMKNAARDVERADSLPTAAVLAARLGRTCSRCHEAQQAIVTFAWEPQPEGAPSLQLQMRRHQWAAARLWEGLIGPSNEMWSQGTGFLATTELDAFAAARGLPRGDVTALATKVHDLATKAGTELDQDARANLYGELLSTCAGCHQLVRPTAVPDP